MPLSRRGFVFSTAAAMAAVPVFSEGVLAEMAASPMPANLPDVWLRLSNNENAWGPCSGACDAVAKAAPRGNRYPQGLGNQLRDKLAKMHDVDPEMIVLGNGSGEILRMAVGAFVTPKRRLVVADPVYEACNRYAIALGRETTKIALIPGDFRHDVAKMMAVDDAGLIYVCNPNNPTASITPKKEVDALVAGMPKGSIALIDEAYFHFCDDPSYETALKHVVAGKDVVVARTFSKVYGLAGYRMGYAVARKDLAEALRRHQLGNNTNIMGLEAAIASLGVADLVPRNREKTKNSQRILTDMLNRNKIAYAPAHANFVFFNINKDVAPVIKAFRERGVEIGRPFPPLTNWLRVSVGTEDEMRSFLKEYETLKV